MNGKLRVLQVTNWDWERRIRIFVGVLTVLWLLLDPLLTLINFSSVLDKFGGWGYAGLLAVSIASPIGLEYFDRRRYLNRMSLIAFQVILIESGQRYQVEVPRDMSVRNFVELFLSKLSLKKQLFSLIIPGHYDNELMAKLEGDYEIISGNLTLGETGIVDNTECRIVGKIKPEYAEVSFGFIMVFLLLSILIKLLNELKSIFEGK